MLNKPARGRLAAALRTLGVVVALILSPAGVLAAEHDIRGIVLSVDQTHHTAMIRHEAFDGMPAMTMPFALSGGPQPQSGEAIRGLVDTGSDPWRLRITHVFAAPTEVPATPMPPILMPGDPIPGTTFVDQNGAPYRPLDKLGSVQVISFIYTRCKDPNMCPLVSAKFAQLQRRIDAKTHLVAISLDPAYDTPAVLTRYGRQFDADSARWSFLTGNTAAVLDFAQRLGVAVLGHPVPSVTLHNESLVVVAPDGTISQRFNDNTWTVDQAADAAHAAGIHTAGIMRYLLVVLCVILIGAALWFSPFRDRLKRDS